VTNRLQEAINCNDGDQAARIIQDALGIESDDVAKYCFPKNWPADHEQRAAIIGEWLLNRGALSRLMPNDERKALERAQVTLSKMTPTTPHDDALAFDLRYAARLMSDAAAKGFSSDAVLNDFRRYAAKALDEAAACLLDRRKHRQNRIELARLAVVMVLSRLPA
jgi:hypothetical protein